MIPYAMPSRSNPPGNSRYYESTPYLTEVRVVLANLHFAVSNLQSLKAKHEDELKHGLEHVIGDDPDYEEMLEALQDAKKLLTRWTGAKHGL